MGLPEVGRIPSPRPVVIDAAAPLFSRKWSEWCDAGVSAVGVTVVVEEDTTQALASVGRWLRLIRQNSDRLTLAATRADVMRAHEQGRTAVILHFQSSRPIGYDVNLVEAFHRIGVRLMQIAYNVRGPLGDGCLEPSDAGLSSLGTAVVKEMNRTGMVVDLAHAGVRTSLEALDRSTAPVVFSHSNARAVCDHPRNLTDDQIRALASNGGVIGLNAYPAFVRSGPGRPTLPDLVRHASHIAGLAGPEHVGLGLDFYDAPVEEYERMIALGVWDREHYPPPPYLYPGGLEGAAGIHNFAEALHQAGFAPREVDGVLGANFLRVFEAVWPKS